MTALEEEAAKSGVGKEIRNFLVVFYAEDDVITLRDPAQLQRAMDMLIGIFERVGLQTNIQKTKAMVCVSGQIRMCQSVAVFNNYINGIQEGDTHKHHRVACDSCGVGLVAS